MKNRRMIWGVIALLFAVGLIVYAVIPGVFNKDVSLWKLVIGIGLAYWLVDRLIFGAGIPEKAECILPLGIALLVYEKNIGKALDIGENFVSNWLVVAVMVLLLVSAHLLFGGKAKVKVSGSGVKTEAHQNRLGGNTVYFDLSKDTVFHASNRLGEMNLYFQNEAMCPNQNPIELYLSNEMGETNVHVPAHWEADCQMTGSFGQINVESSESPKQRKIIIKGTNHMGETNITYYHV